MAKVFISHAGEDKYFVNLLAALLEFHYIDAWCSISDLKPGDQFPDEIEEALNNADSLLVVISKNSMKSKWLIKETVTFQAKKPESQIIPLLLDPVQLDDVIPGFGDYQYIDFTKCMLTGFEKLLSLFGKEFLPHNERRGNKDRRDNNDRRNNSDRRATILTQRMRIGFWNCYSSSSGLGKFDDLWLGVRERFNIMEHLKEEAGKYSYFDEERKQCNVDEVLEKSTNIVWEDFRRRDEFVKAIYVVEAIAEEIKRQYLVKAIDRRSKEDRRSNGDRRNDKTE